MTLRMNGKLFPSFLDFIGVNNVKHRKAIIAQQHNRICIDIVLVMINNEQNMISPIVWLSKLLHERGPDIFGFNEHYIEISSVS